MPLLNSGVNALVTLGVGSAFNAFDNANAYLGVGDSSAAFAVTQTDLQASVNKTYKAMDGGFPTLSAPAATFEATFGMSDANYAWNEWIVMNAAGGGTALNRKVESLGTKPNTQIWVLSVTLTFTTP
jgi:hypothetical protein